MIFLTSYRARIYPLHFQILQRFRVGVVFAVSDNSVVKTVLILYCTGNL